MPPARTSAFLGVLVLAVTTSACTNRESPVNRRPHAGATTAAVVDGVQRVRVEATDTYRFLPSTITVHPGRVLIVLANVGKGAPHDWSLDGLGATTALAGAGETRAVSFTAPAPGRYTFVCTIHRKLGQTGTLVVLDR